MRIGVPKEIKNHEYRVGLTPAVGRRTGRRRAMRWSWRRGAGAGIDFEDAGLCRRRRDDPARRRRGVRQRRHDREGEGAAAAARSRCSKPRHLLFTYLHLAADKPQAEGPDEVRRDLHRL